MQIIFLAMVKLKFHSYLILWFYPIREICENFVPVKCTCFAIWYTLLLCVSLLSGHGMVVEAVRLPLWEGSGVESADGSRWYHAVPGVQWSAAALWSRRWRTPWWLQPDRIVQESFHANAVWYTEFKINVIILFYNERKQCSRLARKIIQMNQSTNLEFMFN